MRNVFVFPRADLQRTTEQLRRVAREEHDGEWFIAAANGSDPTAIYVRIDSVRDDAAPLYCDWDPFAMNTLKAALGNLPGWSVTCDISGRSPGDAEIRALVLELLAEGGVAVDDYSDHPWTAAEIAEDREVDGLRFFDYRASLTRSRDIGQQPKR
jgi:hypothetical protein